MKEPAFTLAEETAFGDFVRSHKLSLSRVMKSQKVIRALWRLAFDMGRELQWENTRRLLCDDCASGNPVEEHDGMPIHSIERFVGGHLEPWRRTCTAREIYAIRPHARHPEGPST